MDFITLYHVSIDPWDEPTKTFAPRVPSCCEYGEDEVTERICLSDSIVNCINAMRQVLGDIDEVVVSVWKKDFSLSDPNLINWRVLYDESLVSDAALTHEYWYINEPVTMATSHYKIGNILEAYDRRTIKYVVDPKYREAIVEKLSAMGFDDPSLETLDACAIINEWLTERFPDECQRIPILESIESVMQELCCGEDVDDGACVRTHDGPRVEYTRWDADPRALYNESDLRLENLGMYYA